MRQRHLSPAVAPLALLLWFGQEPTRQVTTGTVIPPTGPEYAFEHVLGIEVGPDGSILILDPTQKALLRFSPRGEYQGRLGRSGAGPGEFNWPVRMGMLKDQLWVLDAQLMRISVFDKHLAFSRTQALDNVSLISMLDGGAMAMQPLPDPPPQLARIDTQTVVLLLKDPDGTQNRIASWVVNPNQVTLQFGGFSANARQPLVDMPLWDASKDGRSVIFVHEGTTGYPSLVALSPTGQVIFRRSIPWSRVPVTAALFDQTVDSMVKFFENRRPATVSSVPVDRNAVRRVVVRPRDLSAITQLVSGTDGRIWLRRRPSLNAQWVEWHSFLGNGTPESSILVPATTEVFTFTNRSVWGLGPELEGERRVVEHLLPTSLQRQ